MDCPKCGKFVRCIDSRKKLSYVSDLLKSEAKPVRERKYVCGKCEVIYITREYIFREFRAEGIRDKRIKKRNKK